MQSIENKINTKTKFDGKGKVFLSIPASIALLIFNKFRILNFVLSQKSCIFVTDLEYIHNKEL